MGCDIHSFAEVRKEGKWVKVGKVFPNPYHDPERPNSVEEDGFEWNAKLTDHPYDCRNYDMFAILANVRNGRGFAGCDTGDGFRPIAMPRGMPKDMSDEVMAEYTLQVLPDDHHLQDKRGYCTLEDARHWVQNKYSRWVERDIIVTGPDWHSASWLTLRELEEYDWDQTTKHRGYVYPDEFTLFLKNGKPDSWCGDSFGPKKVSNSEMKQLIKDGKANGGWMSKTPNKYITQVEWEEPYRESAKDFLETVLPELRKLGGPDDVRIVFFFDN